MAEYIFELNEALYDEETGEACFKPTVKGELVRCKDCKYYGRVDKRRFYRGSDCIKNIIDTIIPDTDFCSRGERRE